MLTFELTNFVLNVFCLLNSNAVPVLFTPSYLSNYDVIAKVQKVHSEFEFEIREAHKELSTRT